eukprot:gene1299-11383_t
MSNQKKPLKFTLVDPSKKKEKKDWIERIPLRKKNGILMKLEQKSNFKTFVNSKKHLEELKNPTIREILIKKINKKLKQTNLSFESLEKMYGDATDIYVLMDVKGNSIWFNPSYMDMTKRCFADYLSLNFVEIMLRLNPEHPFTQLFLTMLEDRPKEVKIEASQMITTVGSLLAFKAHYTLIEDSIEGPMGYLLHLIPNTACMFKIKRISSSEFLRPYLSRMGKIPHSTSYSDFHIDQ